MKKVIIPILLFVMLFPIIVYAATCDANSIKVTSVEVKNKNGNASELEEANINGTSINLKLKMIEVGDNIDYTIKIKNDSDEDYELDNTTLNSNTDYFEYSLKSDDNSNIVPANSTKTMNLNVKYKTAVADSAFQDGKYNDVKNLVVNLSNETTNNPFTNDLVFIYLLLFYVCLFVFIVIIRKEKKVIVPIIIGLVALPFSVNALCKSELTINSNTLINKAQLKTFNYSCIPGTQQYYEGMTIKEWIKSSFYKGRIQGEFATMEACVDLFGNNAGCKVIDTYKNYSYPNPYVYYGIDPTVCNNDITTCEEYNGTLYKLEYSYTLYDTYEECREDYYEEDTDVCRPENDKYVAIQYDVFESEQECTDELQYYSEWPYKTCKPVNGGYIVTAHFRDNYDTLEECEEHKREGTTCTEEVTYHYGPDEKDPITPDFLATFYDDGCIFGNGNYLYGHLYDDVIESKTYECDRGGECVSPESNILSRNNTTIKAKNIKENDKIAYYDFKTNKIEIGTVTKVYIHKDATNLIRYTLSDNTYLEVTDYHPIYTKSGWKSYTGRNGYAKPVIGDQVKTSNGYKSIIKITPFNGREDYYDFQIKGQDGKLVNNYYANGILVEGSY